MSDHLPECDDYRNPRLVDECICSALRAYGERVRDACIDAVRNVAAQDEGLYWNIRLPRLIDAIREAK